MIQMHSPPNSFPGQRACIVADGVIIPAYSLSLSIQNDSSAMSRAIGGPNTIPTAKNNTKITGTMTLPVMERLEVLSGSCENLYLFFEKTKARRHVKHVRFSVTYGASEDTVDVDFTGLREVG